MPTQQDQHKQHYADVAYHNARVFEEAVNTAPAGIDKDALREALRPLVDEWNKNGGYLGSAQVDRVKNAVVRYAQKVLRGGS